MPTVSFDRLKVIDVDTHVVEPPDLWTSRVSTRKWGDLVPHVRQSESGMHAWFSGDRMLSKSVASGAYAGWDGYNPDCPPTLAQAALSTWDPVARLERMDQDGIFSQVLYPNVAGFGAGKFTTLPSPVLALELIRAYNDFLTDYALVAPDRFLPMSAVPFWDISQAVAEVQRTSNAGHRGLIMTAVPESWGQPPLEDTHWDPLWSCAQEAELPINFHIASGDVSGKYDAVLPGGRHAQAAGRAVSFFIGNSDAITRVICGGLCHRFPKLNFVSVESGVGWIPFLLEALEWQWFNCGVHLEHPEYDLTPREYFKRQVFGCFWFEDHSLRAAVEQLGADNFLFETDFPHPTCLCPGPASIAPPVRDYLQSTLGDMSASTIEKLVQNNAARLYRVPV